MKLSDVGTEVSVVLPAHNEELLLPTTVAEIHQALARRGWRFEVLIVENGSTDRTPEIARELAGALEQVRHLSLPEGDYGLALKQGFEQATGAIVVNFDVDYYDCDFADVGRKLIESGEVAAVVASKTHPDADDRRPWLRRALTGGFTQLLRHLFRMPVGDAHGMKVLDRAAFVPIVRRCVLTRSLFDVEMIIRAGRADLKIGEIPAVVVERRPPRSGVGRRLVEVAVGMVKLAFALRKRTSEVP